MELFGVSPIELLFIAILGLIIFGPERLPEIGRFLGRTVARVLAWQHTSPEAQMLTELRRDFEQQIVDIRDEMLYARQQLDVRSELSELQRETEALLRGTIAPVTKASTPTAPAPTPVAPEPPVAPVDLTDPSPVQVPPPPSSDMSDILTPPDFSNIAAASTSGTAATREEIDALTEQIHTLSATLQTLQEQLRQRGVLDAAWQPPSAEVAQEQIV